MRAAGADAWRMLISQSSRFSELQSRLHGQVLTDIDEAWDSARQTFNVRVDQRPPPSYAWPTRTT